MSNHGLCLLNLDVPRIATQDQRTKTQSALWLYNGNCGFGLGSALPFCVRLLCRVRYLYVCVCVCRHVCVYTLTYIHTQRVQVPNIQGPWSQKPFRVWFLEPETSNIGCPDRLGYVCILVCMFVCMHTGPEQRII